MSMWPKTVIIGTMLNGVDMEERIPGDGLWVDDGWAFVRTAYKLYEDGRREGIGPITIDDANKRLAQRRKSDPVREFFAGISLNYDGTVRVYESDNERFDRIKLEAHERRALDNVLVDAEIAWKDFLGACAETDAAEAKSSALASAFARSAPLDSPRLGGKRAGLEG